MWEFEATKVTKELTYHNEAGGVSGQGLCNATSHVVGNYVRKEPPNKGKEPVDEDMVQGDTGGNDSDGDASDSSEDSMENIYFDDSEEDRDLGLDDGFSDIEDEMTGEKDDDQPKSSTRRIKKKRLKTMKHPVHEAAASDTLVARHTCGRVFGNNNAKAGWVAKVIVNKMMSNNKVPPPTENDVNEPPPTQSSQAAAQPPQTDEAPAVAPRKRGRPRSIATTAAGSQTSRASRGSKGKWVSNKTTQAKKKGKGIESSAQGEQQNTSQAAENPDQNPVHSLYGMMLAWGEAMGSKEKFTDAFKKAGISEDQIGSVEPSPIVQGFQTAAAALSRLQHAASQGSNQGGMQNATADIGILLHTLGHTAGSTLQTESVQQCVNALHETAEQLNEAQPSPVPNDGGQAIDAVARESQEKGDSVPKAPAT
ncbi:hypothetical protein SESBI_40276 [Sesbania bispinosa]|nr:hypothetical protein SESBI_40276 [Sesbania bispinosa]